MAADSVSENTVLRLWLLLHRVRDVVSLCEDSVFRKYGITMEQFGLLATVKGGGGALRPVDLASFLERSSNSVSMLVDRMVKAGLVRRTRDKKDRRLVFVSLTSKGENALEPAARAGWELIHEILSPLSNEDRQSLVNKLEIVKSEAFRCLNPEMNIADITRNSITKRPDLYESSIFAKSRGDSEKVTACGSEAKRQSGKKGRVQNSDGRRRLR